MFILQTGLVLVAVYIAPALAVRPQLAFDARTAAAIPFISVFLVFIASSALIRFDLYAPPIVQALSALAIVTAVVRVWRIKRAAKTGTGWTDFDRAAAAVALALGLYVGLRLIEGGFDENDEIYSWNMWAIQHYLGETIDYFYTQSPYPQLFPKLISYGYMLFGSFEAQTPVKTALVVFPVAIFFMIGLAAREDRSDRALFLQAALGLVLLLGAEFSRIFDNGMPDTMMTAAILSSMLFLFLHQEDKGRGEFLILSACSAIVAALSKQPGLIWALFSLPALLVYGAVRRRNPWRDLFVGLVPALCAVLWMMTEGRNFQENDGVLSRSLEDRDYLSQLAFSASEWFLETPVILALAAFALFAVLRNKRGGDALLLFTVPSLAAWFIYASYDIRAGAPAVASLALLAAYARFGLKPAKAPQGAAVRRIRPRYLLIGALFAISAGGGAYELNKYANRYDHYRIGHTSLSNLFDIFGADARLVYDQILRRDVSLWTPTNYVYGLFYGHTELIRPPREDEPYDAATLLRHIRAERPDYLTNSGGVPIGTGGAALDALAGTLCPDLFERIAGPDEQYGIAVYRLNKTLLDSGYCDL